MGYTKVYIHFVWATKNRHPFLTTRELRAKLWAHIKVNAISKNIRIDTINGFTEHCHCLIEMTHDQTLSTVMQLIKGESAYWVNRNNLVVGKFEWQERYYAVSVSYSGLSRVRDYINNQEDHHTVRSFQEEYNDFLERAGILICDP